MSSYRDRLDRWQKDEVARVAWEKFTQTPEFDRGLRLLEGMNSPVVIPNESTSQTAKRQSYQAGFHMALQLVSQLHKVHFKKIQENIPEWEHVIPEDYPPQEEQE